jgi:SAM-dependent methyltransferase
VADESEPCCFDDWSADYARRARSRELGGVSEDLIDGLERAGLEGRTILDVGCGAGGLVMEALERGATSATGVDLSPASIDEARRIASERGLAARTRFEVANGASVRLEPHDVVVLDKVFCCDGDVEGLLRNSLDAERLVPAPPEDVRELPDLRPRRGGDGRSYPRGRVRSSRVAASVRLGRRGLRPSVKPADHVGRAPSSAARHSRSRIA